MINADGLLYIANFFCKEALWGESETKKAHELISWLTDRGITLEETEGWLNQNEEILNSFLKFNQFSKVNSFKSFQQDFTEHYLVIHGISGIKLTYTIISTDQKPRDDIDLEIDKEGFLKGYKNIPNLYMYTAFQSNFKSDPGPKELAQYKFLDSVFLLAASRNNPDFKSEVDSFISNNKIKIDKLLSSCAYWPKELGAGDDGVAYSVSPKLVLKIFTDQFSFLKAKEAYERLHKNPELGKNEAMIYDLGILGKFFDKTIYYYIIEKMEVLNPAMKNYLTPIIGAIGAYIKNNIDTFKYLSVKLNDPKNYKNVNSYINNEAEKIKEYLYINYPDQIETIESAEELRTDWVKDLAEEIIFKHITQRNDLHLGNLGLTDYGKFVYFDPAHEYWEDNTSVLNTPGKDDIDFLEQDGVEPNSFDDLFI